MITWLKANAVMLASCAIVSGVMYLKGRSDAAEKCTNDKLAAAEKAAEEKEADDDLQQDAGAVADDALRTEIARLRRRLETSDVTTGLDCDAPGSGDSVHDAHDQLFETGLLAGGGSDDAGTGAHTPAMGEG